MSLELKFTPLGISNIEKQAGKPIFELISDYSIGNLVLLASGAFAGDMVKADEALAKYMQDGHDFLEVFADILEGLQKSGFLPKALSMADLRATLNDPKLFEEMQSELGKVTGKRKTTAPSQNSGKRVKN